MKQKLQWKVSNTINAPIEKVWDVTQDLSSIPKYHPVVGNVNLLSSQVRRAPGVEYQCVISEGPKQGSCVEKVIENIPYKMTSTLSVCDTWGLSKMLKDYITETSVDKIGSNKTVLTLAGYYEPIDFKARIINVLFIKRMMKKRGADVINGIKKMVEK